MVSKGTSLADPPVFIGAKFVKLQKVIRMNSTTLFHNAYWANYLLLRQHPGSADTLGSTIASARVDLNPHQIDAAVFALRSPFSKGVILADEVGLGKTIEAGIVIAQRWAERKRNILLVLPATLRKQWQQELEEKFGLKSVILESKNFNQHRRQGSANPFTEIGGHIVICSYNFVAAKAAEVKRVPWDLVVIDEAHRMRNVYKPSNKTARAISEATQHAQKLLLTATPLQNSLLELHGLVSVIDPHVFGPISSFREQFVRAADEGSLAERRRNTVLRQRLNPICKRTLRKQVLEYIRFTARIPLTQEFLPTDAEQQLYEEVSSYLQRHELFALPSSQRQLMTLVLRKLLASSSFAIAGTLRGLVNRLEQMRQGMVPDEEELDDALGEDFESFDEVRDEWTDDEAAPDPQLELLDEELQALRGYASLAESIGQNAKGEALLTVLGKAFTQLATLGAQRKAVIFTESRRTQEYLFNLLSEHGYAGEIAMMNGSNTDPTSKEIYARWQAKHPQAAGTGSRSADIKAAIVEAFREDATILLATESAAEGVNLQFCSLVINYDLPWNPQRVEQRIGRCHRYGQQHDVVVVNFLNKRNEADQRVYQLLSEKFRLFEGVFGSSDEILGSLESGVDLERRIAEVYQTCRTPEEIQAAFDALQSELEATIQSRLADTRQTLLENVDEAVSAKLNAFRDQARAALSRREQVLLDLTRGELGAQATFDPGRPRFRYQGQPYNLDWKAAEAADERFYHAHEPLAADLIAQALGRPCPADQVLSFDLHSYGAIISALEPYRQQSGWLELTKLTVSSASDEDYLVFSGVTDRGETVDPEACEKLFNLNATSQPVSGRLAPCERLSQLRAEHTQMLLQGISARNLGYFNEEEGKLEAWADDLKLGLEQDLKEIDRGIKEAKRQAKLTQTLQEKLEVQKLVKDLERQRSRKRRELYDEQDRIDAERERLIGEIEAQLKLSHSVQEIFTVRWSLT